MPATDTGIPAHVLDLQKSHFVGGAERTQLENVTASFQAGAITAVFGPSGAGKSVLYNILAGLDQADSGRAFVAGNDLSQLTAAQLTKLRRTVIGLIPEGADLVPTLSVGENLLLPMGLAGKHPAADWFDAVVAAAGIKDLLKLAPADLGPGQQQLVAAVRAILPRPNVILADEPTGRLLSGEGERVLRLLEWARSQAGATIVLFTHDPAVAARAQRVLILSDGRIRADLQRPSLVAMLTKLAELEASRGSGQRG